MQRMRWPHLLLPRLIPNTLRVSLMLTKMLPPHSLLTQPPLDSRRVQPPAHNRGTTVQRMRCVYLLLQKSLDSRRVHLLSHPATNLLSHPANLLSHPATNLPSHPATNLLTLTLSLLPRNRGTALGIVQSEVQEMQLLLKTLRILLLLEMILLPTRLLLLQPLLDSWRVHPLAHNRGTALPRRQTRPLTGRSLLLLKVVTRSLPKTTPIDSRRVHLLSLRRTALPTSTLVQLSDFYFIASSFRLSDFYSIASSFWSMIAGNQD